MILPVFAPLYAIPTLCMAPELYRATLDIEIAYSNTKIQPVQPQIALFEAQ